MSFWRSHLALLMNGWSLVCMRSLVSLRPFFIFSSCLSRIIKRDDSWESTFSKKRVRWCTSFANLGCCLWNWNNGRSKTKYLWHSTADEFFDLQWGILEFATTENHNKCEISEILIPRRPWDERILSMVARLMRVNFSAKAKTNIS